MSRRKLIVPLAAAAGVAFFFYALIHLILMRYDRGDLYPPSSTLRADPLGLRAFYEALPDAGNYEVRRGFVSLRREIAQKPATLFLVGMNADGLGEFAPDEIEQLDDYVKQGGRVVITLMPVSEYHDSSELTDKEKAALKKKEDEEERDRKAKEKANKNKKEEEKGKAQEPAFVVPEPPGKPKTAQEKYERDEYKQIEQIRHKIDPDRYVPDKFHPSLQAVWGFGWATYESEDDDKKKDKDKGKDKAKAAAVNEPTVEYSPNGDVLAARTGPAPAEDKVPWKSPVSFVRIEPAWQVDYQAKGKPVLIARKWGKGEIVVASDSYFASNEALRDDRKPRLLGWIAGSPGLLLFDETHLGTQEREGVMVLARRYRLEGYLYGLLIVAGLFLWRQSVPLVPPAATNPQDATGGAVSGKDSRSGLVNLLRRNIGPRELLSTCLAEWRRHAPSGRSAARTAEMETLLASAETAQPGRIVETYRQLCDINTGGRHP